MSGNLNDYDCSASQQSNFHVYGGMKMMDKIPHDELVAKINEFTKISRERDLTEEEAKERAKYREEYLRRIRQSVRGNLSGVEYKGNKN